MNNGELPLCPFGDAVLDGLRETIVSKIRATKRFRDIARDNFCALRNAVELREYVCRGVRRVQNATTEERQQQESGVNALRDEIGFQHFGVLSACGVSPSDVPLRIVAQLDDDVTQLLATASHALHDLEAVLKQGLAPALGDLARFRNGWNARLAVEESNCKPRVDDASSQTEDDDAYRRTIIGVKRDSVQTLLGGSEEFFRVQSLNIFCLLEKLRPLRNALTCADVASQLVFPDDADVETNDDTATDPRSAGDGDDQRRTRLVMETRPYEKSSSALEIIDQFVEKLELF